MKKTMNKKAQALTPERHLARFAAEKARLARAYCDIFKFWRECPCKRCRRARRCSGDHNDCVKRCDSEIARDVQWQARQQILQATRASAGPPERTAREFLPGDLCSDVSGAAAKSAFSSSFS